MSAEEQQLASKQGGRRLLREVVTEAEIAEVVASWTGIPVARLQEGERQKVLRLDEILHERIVGQDEAVQAVADAMIRARSGIKDTRRPIGSFIFLGPTGVGKTELARTLADALFDSDQAMIRLDLSEYQERHTVAGRSAPHRAMSATTRGPVTAPFAASRSRRAVRRDQKAPGRVQHAAVGADDGRLTDGRTHRELPQHGDHHDLQHRLRLSAGRRDTRR